MAEVMLNSLEGIWHTDAVQSVVKFVSVSTKLILLGIPSILALSSSGIIGLLYGLIAKAMRNQK